LDADVTLLKRYFYVVVAMTDEGKEAAPSDTLSYLLLEKPVNVEVGEGTRPSFSWTDPNTPPLAFYYLRLMEKRTGRRIWTALVPSSYSGGRETVEYNVDGSALLSDLVAGVEYQIRIDVLGSEFNSGSESPWGSFEIQ
jgi:hypothetical protein